VATLDRFVEAMSKQQGEALVFKPGAAPELVVGGTNRLVSSRAVTAEQLEQLLTEALGPGVLAGLGGGRGSFAYQGPFGAVTIQVAQGPGGWHARVLPATEGAAVPAERLGARQAPKAAAVQAGPVPASIDELFGRMLDLKASDPHLKSGKVPYVRVDGAMQPIPGLPLLGPQVLEALVHPIMPERNRA
jgi:hypothetical protein